MDLIIQYVSNATYTELFAMGFGYLFQRAWHNLILAVIVVVTSIYQEYSLQLFQFNRHLIGEGEWWRILSSNIVHISWNHSLLNLASLAIVTFCFIRDLNPLRDVFAMVACFLGAGFGLYFFSPEIELCVGMSGALYGYWFYYILATVKMDPKFSLIAFLLLVGYVFNQQFLQDIEQTSTFVGGSVALDSHFYGTITGIITGLISLCIHYEGKRLPASNRA